MGSDCLVRWGGGGGGRGGERERERREKESSPSCRSYLHTNLCPSLYSCCEFNLLLGFIRSSGFTRDVLTEQHSRKLKKKKDKIF